MLSMPPATTVSAWPVLNGLCGQPDGFEARPANLVDRQRGNFRRHASAKRPLAEAGFGQVPLTRQYP